MAADPRLAEIMKFLEDDVLPDNDKRVRELAMTQAQYEITDGVYITLNLTRPFELYYLQMTGS